MDFRQSHLGQQIFDETLQARRALAEISSVQKQLVDAQQRPTVQDTVLKSRLAEAQSSLSKILTNKENTQAQGLEEAYKDLASALLVVEGGDRPAPSQAVAVFKQSSQQIMARISEWTAFKQTRLLELNQQLRRANLMPIAIAAIEQEVEFLMSR